MSDCPVTFKINEPGSDPAIIFEPELQFAEGASIEQFYADVGRDYRQRAVNLETHEKARAAAIQGVLQDWWERDLFTIEATKLPPVRSLPNFKGEVQESIVKQLKAALDIAEKGELRDIAVIGAYKDGDLFLTTSKSDNRFDRLGRIIYSVWLLIKEADVDSGLSR